MTAVITLTGTKCVLLDTALASVGTGNLSKTVTFDAAGSLTADGPYLYCSALTAADVTIRAAAGLDKGNAVTPLTALALTAYAVPDAPLISR